MWTWYTVIIVGFYSQCDASENIHTSPSSPRSLHGRFTSLLVWTFHLTFLLSFFAFKTLLLVFFSTAVFGVGIRLFLETSNLTLCYEDWATSWGEGEGRQWREVCFWSLPNPTLFKTNSVHFVTLLRSRDLFGGSKYDALLENISFS